MSKNHRALLIIWLALLAMFSIGVVAHITPFAVLPFFGGMVLAAFTYRSVYRDGLLRHPLVYRATLAPLLASAAVTMVAAGSTVMFASGSPIRIVGFIALGTLNLVLVVGTWRALVRPDARRAALVGMIAVITEMFAMIADILFNVSLGAITAPATGVAFVAMMAAFVTIGTGALACIGALASFAKADRASVPAARVVEA